MVGEGVCHGMGDSGASCGERAGGGGGDGDALMDEIDGGNCGGHRNGSPIAPCLVLASPWRVSGGVPQCSEIEVLELLTSSHRKPLECWDELLMASASIEFALQTGGN